VLAGAYAKGVLSVAIEHVMPVTPVYRAELHFETERKYQVIDITSDIEDAVANAPMTFGLCHVYVVHTTAALTIHSDVDPNMGMDIMRLLHGMVPEDMWEKDLIDENRAARALASILGQSETLPVQDGQLLLGTWQALMLVEFDGPRNRRLIVTVQ
jgi:secondary thiamine-phosphate synthase enzyme